MPESSPVPNDATETTRYRVAFESCRADIEAVPESELIPITVDVPSMVAMLLGAVGTPARSATPSAPSTPTVLGPFAPPSASGDPIPPGMPGASPFLRE